MGHYLKFEIVQNNLITVITKNCLISDDIDMLSKCIDTDSILSKNSSNLISFKFSKNQGQYFRCIAERLGKLACIDYENKDSNPVPIKININVSSTGLNDSNKEDNNNSEEQSYPADVELFAFPKIDYYKIIILALSFFDNFTIPTPMKEMVHMLIKTLKIDYNYLAWNQISSSSDYGLTLFINRKLPYYNINSKEWVLQNILAHDGNYEPAESSATSSAPTEVKKTKKAIIMHDETIPLSKYKQLDNTTKKMYSITYNYTGRGTTTMYKLKNRYVNKQKRKVQDGKAHDGKAQDSKIDHKININQCSTSEDNLDHQLLDIEKEYQAEIELSTKNNNFTSWPVLTVVNYPDLDEIIKELILIYNMGFKKEVFTICMLYLVNPRFAHIISKPDFWDLVNLHINTESNNKIFTLCYSYALYILKQEETIIFNKIREDHRILFTLEQANKLPVMENTPADYNPYICQLTTGSSISFAIPLHLREKRTLCTIEEFNNRLELATGGAFNNINLAEYQAAITGSILVPCVHISPLEIHLQNAEIEVKPGNYPYMTGKKDAELTEKDINFLKYLEFYYPGYVSLNQQDFINETTKVTDEKKDNELDDIYDSEDAVSEVKITKNVIKDKEEKSKNRVPDYNQLADIDVSITCYDHSVFRNLVFELFEKISKNCEHRGPIYINEISTITSTKFKIYGPGIPRPIDMFRITKDPILMIKTFHVPVVKMYYSDNLIMMRSCISALLSGVNESYKWFSCNKIAADVLLKYAQRGFSIILNDTEKKIINSYITNSDRWSNILKQLKTDAYKIYSGVTSKNAFFRADNYGCRMGLKKITFANDTQNNLLSIQNSTGFKSYKNKKCIKSPDLTSIMNSIDEHFTDRV